MITRYWSNSGAVTLTCSVNIDLFKVASSDIHMYISGNYENFSKAPVSERIIEQKIEKYLCPQLILMVRYPKNIFFYIHV